MGVVATKLHIAGSAAPRVVHGTVKGFGKGYLIRCRSEVASMRLLKRVAQPISERPLRFSISTI